MSDERTPNRPGDQTGVITKSKTETKKPSMYKVLLLNDDYTPMEFVVAVLMRATRHLLSTTLTTMAGFTPLILAGGGFWPPVAVAIGGGVAGATTLAVTFVPAMYVLVNRRRWRAGSPS